MSDEHTLSTPLKTVAKLPLPISSSILKDPTVVSPIFTRRDDEDWGGLAAMLDGLSTDRSSFTSSYLLDRGKANIGHLDMYTLVCL